MVVKSLGFPTLIPVPGEVFDYGFLFREVVIPCMHPAVTPFLGAAILPVTSLSDRFKEHFVFSVFLAFDLLLGWSADIQVHRMLDQKVEVPFPCYPSVWCIAKLTVC